MFRCKNLCVYFTNLVLVAACMMFSSQEAKATHAMGGDLTYTCIGPNQYQISLSIYRDCNGIGLGGGATLNYSSACAGVNANLNLVRQSQTELNNILCPTANSACSGSGNIGVEQHIYTGILNLPAGCDDWIISWRLCCRNLAITTLNNGNADAMYVEDLIDNTVTPCNNSPIFGNLPTVFTCIGQPVFYNHGAFDPDGDQLVYSLVNCLEDDGDVVEYVGGINTAPNGANPLVNTVSGVNLDPNTGAITFTPTAAEAGIVCVLVEEFRNGVLIGSIVRDIQFTTINCNNNLPTVTGVNGATGGGIIDYQTSSCFNQQLCFDVTGTDGDAGQNLTMIWNGAIPGATFVTTPPGNPITGTFCWTPTAADTGQHTFTVTIFDDDCPLLGSNTFTYTINVISNPNDPVDAGLDQIICEGETVSLAAVSSAGNIDRYEWSPALPDMTNPNNATTDVTPAATTTYTVTLYYLDGCTSTDDVTVEVITDPVVDVSPNNANVCEGSVVTLTGVTDVAGMDFNWYDVSNNLLASGNMAGTASTTLDVTTSSPGPTIDTFYFEVTNPITGCTTVDTSVLLVGQPNPDPACINIYVNTTGLDNASGTQLDPTNLREALRRVQCNNAVIKMATGTYNIDTVVTLRSYVTIEGGFLETSLWTKTSLAGATTINRTALNPDGVGTVSPRLVMFEGNGATNFRIQDVTITTVDGSATAVPGMCTYGIHLQNCSNYDITRVQIQAGNAEDGNGRNFDPTAFDGVDGLNGA
ncbi:MAG: hypothetical protein MK212_14960, partial [Saprospiraceae bacterium]|nr:hypothetical protein [Saprospiraceae bacterium]